MNDEILEKYREAGLIAAKILRDGAKEIRIGTSYLDIVESIESRVIDCLLYTSPSPRDCS